MVKRELIEDEEEVKGNGVIVENGHVFQVPSPSKKKKKKKKKRHLEESIVEEEEAGSSGYVPSAKRQRLFLEEPELTFGASAPNRTSILSPSPTPSPTMRDTVAEPNWMTDEELEVWLVRKPASISLEELYKSKLKKCPFPTVGQSAADSVSRVKFPGRGKLECSLERADGRSLIHFRSEQKKKFTPESKISGIVSIAQPPETEEKEEESEAEEVQAVADIHLRPNHVPPAVRLKQRFTPFGIEAPPEEGAATMMKKKKKKRRKDKVGNKSD